MRATTRLSSRIGLVVSWLGLAAPRWQVAPLATAAACASMAFIAGCASEGRWHLAEGQRPQHFARQVTRMVGADLLLYLPKGFDERGARKYPLLIFLHGSGESGHDLQRVRAHGPPALVGDRPDFPFIVASPQAPEGWQGFDPVMLNAMLDELVARLPIDIDRIYLTGLSMGGEWSYGWASMSPNRFAAIAPVCGAWNPEVACRLKNVPVWAFHGAQDTVVPIADDQAMVEAINQCGGDARITVYPDVGHDAWTPAYADSALFDWLLAHRRRATDP